MNKKKPEQQLPTVEVSTWENDDGSYSAHLDVMTEGIIWAKNITTLYRGMGWLMEQLIKAEENRKKLNSDTGVFDAGMQAGWIDGAYLVRWLPISGFGVEFQAEELLKPWLKVLLEAARQGVEKAK